MLITRDLARPGTEAGKFLREELVCVGSPVLAQAHCAKALSRWPMIAARSRPDVIASQVVAKEISPERLHVGAIYDHLFWQSPMPSAERAFDRAPVACARSIAGENARPG